jgi:hypothetical protein
MGCMTNPILVVVAGRIFQPAATTRRALPCSCLKDHGDSWHDGMAHTVPGGHHLDNTYTQLLGRCVIVCVQQGHPQVSPVSKAIKQVGVCCFLDNT